MVKVEKDMFVSVEYTGTLTNGEVFDTSNGRQPLEIQIGAGQLIKGFEQALEGMAVNEKKTFTLEPDEAYGQIDESLTRAFPRADVPPEMNPEVGQTVGLHDENGQQIPATIVDMNDEHVTVDLNHPMAGKALTFDIEVVGISETPTQTPDDCGSGCGCDCSSGCS
ncbi:MAG: peptidylprolyl isomerase [Desulfobacteraceae bacterium]|nr:peptidylprolyl isomerase [Desulfobacteraceae bacterium]MBC2757216.1 peptidylprolyl isomerase [Desulfobacteraceae bacterium]